MELFLISLGSKFGLLMYPSLAFFQTFSDVVSTSYFLSLPKKVLTSLKTFLIEFQSFDSPRRTITHSMTNTTPWGGDLKALISTMESLSSLDRANWAASNSGLAAARSASASSAIAYASVAFLLTTSASAETTFSVSSASALSLLTISRATASCSFFSLSFGYISANLILSSAIFVLVSFNFLRPIANLFLFKLYSVLFCSSTWL